MIVFLLNRSDQIDQLSFLFMFSMREIQSEYISSCGYDDDDNDDSDDDSDDDDSDDDNDDDDDRIIIVMMMMM